MALPTYTSSSFLTVIRRLSNTLQHFGVERSDIIECDITRVARSAYIGESLLSESRYILFGDAQVAQMLWYTHSYGKGAHCVDSGARGFLTGHAAGVHSHRTGYFGIFVKATGHIELHNHWKQKRIGDAVRHIEQLAHRVSHAVHETETYV